MEENSTEVIEIMQELNFLATFCPRGQGGEGYVNGHPCTLEGSGGQNWVKIGPNSCWMAPHGLLGNPVIFTDCSEIMYLVTYHRDFPASVS